jgi:hypothetical protein
MDEVYISGKGRFIWSSIYHNYSSNEGKGGLLYESDLINGKVNANQPYIFRSEVIRKKLVNPITTKYMDDVWVNGKGLFRWNSVWKTYTGDGKVGMGLLVFEDIKKINLSKSK